MEKNRGKLEGRIGLFENNIRQYKGGGYDEARARVDFIDKFFSHWVGISPTNRGILSDIAR